MLFGLLNDCHPLVKLHLVSICKEATLTWVKRSSKIPRSNNLIVPMLIYHSMLTCWHFNHTTGVCIPRRDVSIQITSELAFNWKHSATFYRSVCSCFVCLRSLLPYSCPHPLTTPMNLPLLRSRLVSWHRPMSCLRKQGFQIPPPHPPPTVQWMGLAFAWGFRHVSNSCWRFPLQSSSVTYNPNRSNTLYRR